MIKAQSLIADNTRRRTHSSRYVGFINIPVTVDLLVRQSDNLLSTSFAYHRSRSTINKHREGFKRPRSRIWTCIVCHICNVIQLPVVKVWSLSLCTHQQGIVLKILISSLNVMLRESFRWIFFLEQIYFSSSGLEAWYFYFKKIEVSKRKSNQRQWTLNKRLWAIVDIDYLVRTCLKSNSNST